MKDKEALSLLDGLRAQALELRGNPPFNQAHTRWQFNLASPIREIFGNNSVYEQYLGKLTYSLRGTAYMWSYDERFEIDQKWYDEDLGRAAGVIESAMDEVKAKGISKIDQGKKKNCFLSYKFTDQGKRYGCVIRSKPSSESGACRPPNPEHAVHAIRRMPSIFGMTPESMDDMDRNLWTTSAGISKG